MPSNYLYNETNSLHVICQFIYQFYNFSMEILLIIDFLKDYTILFIEKKI